MNKPGLRGYNSKGRLGTAKEKKPGRIRKEYNEHPLRRGEVFRGGLTGWGVECIMKSKVGGGKLFNLFTSGCKGCILRNIREWRRASKGLKGFISLVVTPLSPGELKDFKQGAGEGMILLSDPGRESFRAFRVSSLPALYLLDEQGKIAYTSRDKEPFKRAISRIIHVLKE